VVSNISNAHVPLFYFGGQRGSWLVSLGFAFLIFQRIPTCAVSAIRRRKKAVRYDEHLPPDGERGHSGHVA